MWLNWSAVRREMAWVGFWRKREYQSAWCLGGDCSRCGGQRVRKCESHGFCGWSVGFWACVCLTKSGVSGKDCKGVAVQKDKRERNLWLCCNTCSVSEQLQWLSDRFQWTTFSVLYTSHQFGKCLAALSLVQLGYLLHDLTVHWRFSVS